MLKKYKSKKVYLTTFGYLCYTFWAVTTFISVYLPDTMAVQRYNIFITLLLVVGSIILVYNKSTRNNLVEKIFKNSSIIIGSIIIGFILVPVIYPSIRYVRVTKINDLIPKSELDPSMLFFGCLWGIVTIFVIGSMGPNRSDWKKGTSAEKTYIIGKISLSLGALIFLSEFFLTSYLMLYSFLYIINRLIVLIATSFIFYASWVEPGRTYSYSRILIKMIENEEISIISTYLTDIGPEILHFTGLKFIQGRDNKISLIENMAVLGLTLQGSWVKKEFSKGSAIITVPTSESYAGLILTEHIGNEANEKKSKSLSYICLLIIIPKEFEYLLLNREYWEKNFEDFVKKIEKVSNYPKKEQVVEFFKDRFVYIALNS